MNTSVSNRIPMEEAEVAWTPPRPFRPHVVEIYHSKRAPSSCEKMVRVSYSNFVALFILAWRLVGGIVVDEIEKKSQW